MRPPRTRTTIQIPDDLLAWIETKTSEAITVAAVIISAIQHAKADPKFRPEPIPRGAPKRNAKQPRRVRP